MIDPPKLRKAQWQAKVDRATSPSRRLARYEKALREIARKNGPCACDIVPTVRCVHAIAREALENK